MAPLFILLVLSVFLGAEGLKCNTINHEVYKCGTACPRTCKTKDFRYRCLAPCVNGCFCATGYIRRDYQFSGKCVLVKDCPKTVCNGKNEEYTNCGSRCPRTCDNKDRHKVCPAVCVSGCFCKKGYVRHGKDCIKPEQCPSNGLPTALSSVCYGDNEVFNACGTACPRNCENMDEQIICNKTCKKGCFCKAGYVRERSGVVDPGKCVLPKDCPPFTSAASPTEAIEDEDEDEE